MAVPTLITGTGDGADGSLVTFLDSNLPTLGWTTPFTNTSTKGVYRNTPTAGSGGYLRVIDAAADHASDARKASVQTYTSMSDIDTGTDMNPGSGEAYFTKSQTADATSRNWMLWGTNKFFFFFSFMDAGTATRSGWNMFWCGDPAGTFAADPMPFCLGSTDNSGTITSQRHSAIQTVSAGSPGGTDTITNHWTRNFRADAGSITAGLLGAPTGGTTASYEPGSEQAWPNVPNAIPVSKISISEHVATATDRFHRARLPGLLNPLVDIRMSNQATWTDGDTVSGINNGSGIISARFTPLHWGLGFNSNGWTGAILLDTSTDWDDW